jgi:hypothetical protein
MPNPTGEVSFYKRDLPTAALEGKVRAKEVKEMQKFNSI